MKKMENGNGKKEKEKRGKGEKGKKKKRIRREKEKKKDCRYELYSLIIWACDNSCHKPRIIAARLIPSAAGGVAIEPSIAKASLSTTAMKQVVPVLVV